MFLLDDNSHQLELNAARLETRESIAEDPHGFSTTQFISNYADKINQGFHGF